MSGSRPTPWLEAEDLSARARRQALSEPEQKALSRALEQSATLRIAHQIGSDFDRILGVRSGDEQLVQRAADRALLSLGNRRRRPRRGWMLLVAAALTLAATAAALRGAPWRARSSATVPTSAAVATLAAPAALPPVPHPLVAAMPVSSMAPVEPPATARLLAATPPAQSTRPIASAVAEEAPPTAAELFRDANAARRDGDLTGARAQYLRLEHDFPTSSEAQLAHVSLGKLLLGMGRADEAERQFAGYPAEGAPLSEEAWVGRAHSLARLARYAEERRAWEALLRQFPASLYAAEARARLAATTAEP